MLPCSTLLRGKLADSAFSASFFLLLSFLLLVSMRSSAQCTLTCKDVQVSLNEQCEGLINPDLLLAGNPGPGCMDNLIVQLFDEDGNLIPTSPVITGRMSTSP